jgi:type IV secretion system protein VirB8
VFKRSQQEVSDGSQHWYQDKYQHVLTQRNLLALITLVALVITLVAVFAVLRLAPLKSVEPYLLQIDERTGITQKVNPVSRNEYAANEAVDRYFTALYLRTRESYNATILRYNYNVVRLMSATDVFQEYRRQVDPSVEGSVAARLGNFGRRDVKIRSVAYITNPTDQYQKKTAVPDYKIIQARITTTDMQNNQSDAQQNWVVTITFEYATLAITEAEQWINPLGYQVISYQIQREIN